MEKFERNNTRSNDILLKSTFTAKEEEDGSQLFKIIQNYLKSFNRRRKTAHRPREGDLVRAQWPRTRQVFKNLKGNENKNIKNLARDQ